MFYRLLHEGTQRLCKHYSQTSSTNLETVGFAWAVRVMGFIALATLGCAVLLSRPLSPRSPRQLVDLSSFRDLSYLTFLASAFCE